MVPLIQILVLCDSKSKAEAASRLIRFHAGTHESRVFIPFITGRLPEDRPHHLSGNALTTAEAMVTLNAVNVVVYDRTYYETANVEEMSAAAEQLGLEELLTHPIWVVVLGCDNEYRRGFLDGKIRVIGCNDAKASIILAEALSGPIPRK